MIESKSKQRVALFGLGLMGSGMANSLLRNGFPLTIYNRTPEKSAPFVAEGAQSATTPEEAVEQAEVVVSMLADDEASRSVWLGEKGALARMPAGAVLIECSTLSQAWVKELSVAAKGQGCELLDAPVTGSRVHAEAGELKFLVGGAGETLEKARPVLDAMSNSIVHLGPQGSGCLMKLINNGVCGVQLASLAEAMALIERSGLDRDKAGEVLGNGAPGSPLVKALFPRMAKQEYDPHFHLELMAKDLTYACREGEAVQLNLKTVAAALEVFNQAKECGYARKDFTSVVEQFRNQ
jgi:3-hydroxyisobutyrate dehydrogenase